MKVKALIEDAFVEIGVIPAGSELHALDLKWATRKFNSFVKSKSVDGFNLHYRTQEDFTLTPGTSSYTIGGGGAFDTNRPNTIKSALILDVNNNSYPVAISPVGEYWKIPDKTVGGRPISLFYKRTFPLSIIYLYYTPDTSDTLRIISYKNLSTYGDIDDIATEDIDVPGEYEDMFISNLALRIAPRYGRTPTNELKVAARETLQNIRNSNIAKNTTGTNLNFVSGSHRYNVEER